MRYGAGEGGSMPLAMAMVVLRAMVSVVSSDVVSSGRTDDGMSRDRAPPIYITRPTQVVVSGSNSTMK